MNVILSWMSFVACLIPERWVSALARGCGWLWFFVIRYRRRVILENLLQAFPEESFLARHRLAQDACVHLIQTFVEFIRLPRHRREGFRTVRVEGLEHVRRAVAKGRGVLCVSGHLGSFELAVAAGALKVDVPVSLVVKPFPKGVDRFVTRIRRSSGLKVISAKAGLQPIVRALRNNEIVVFVVDQNATRRIGVFVDFFGKKACTMSAPAVIAKRTGAEVISAVAFREQPSEHVLQLGPPVACEYGSTCGNSTEAMTAHYTKVVETAIRRNPAQWFWTHKRWRTRPLKKA